MARILLLYPEYNLMFYTHVHPGLAAFCRRNWVISCTIYYTVIETVKNCSHTITLNHLHYHHTFLLTWSPTWNSSLLFTNDNSSMMFFLHNIKIDFLTATAAFFMQLTASIESWKQDHEHKASRPRLPKQDLETPWDRDPSLENSKPGKDHPMPAIWPLALDLTGGFPSQIPQTNPGPKS